MTMIKLCGLAATALVLAVRAGPVLPANANTAA